MTKCPMCGYSFKEEEARGPCAGCPTSATCGKIHCPNCNYDISKQSRLLAVINKIRRHKDGIN